MLVVAIHTEVNTSTRMITKINSMFPKSEWGSADEVLYANMDAGSTAKSCR
jgi:hypothetical protein